MRFATIAVLGAALVGFCGVTGCDREVARTEKVKVDDDSVKRESTVIKERPDGTVVKEEIESKQEVK